MGNSHQNSRSIKLNQKKLVLTILTIIVFIVGYYIAPEPFKDGEYSVYINYNTDVDLHLTFKINLDSNIDFPLKEHIINTTSGSMTLSISFFEYYPGKIGNSIQFYAMVYNDETLLNNINTNDFYGRISNDNNEIKFSGMSIENNSVSFSIRILKHSNVALGLLFGISFLWLTELIPLAASSLIIPVIIVIAKIDNARGALAGFSEPIIFLFLAGFLMAEAMKRSGLDEYISLRLISVVPAKPKVLILSMMVLSSVFSMFMSNTAAVAVLIPIAVQLLNTSDMNDIAYKRTMVLGIAYAATIGGIGTMIGTPPNIIAISFLEEYNSKYAINFAQWLLIGLPVVFVMIPITFIYLWYIFHPTIDDERLKKAKTTSIKNMAKQNKMTTNQIIVSIIFLFIITMWLTTSIHKISASIIAVIGAILFYFTGQIKQEDLNKINWNALLTFGGGLSLGYVIIETGLADYIAIKFSLLGNIPSVLIIIIVAIISLILTAIASNTASAAILIPIIMPVGASLGIHPILLAVVVAIGCSVDFALVIGSPPTMMAYSTGIFKTDEIFKIGIILDVIGIITVIILSIFYYPIVIGLFT